MAISARLLGLGAMVGLLGGCGNQCLDDGLAWNQSMEACMALETATESASATEATESASATAPTEASATNTMSASATMGSNSMSASASATQTASETDTDTDGVSASATETDGSASVTDTDTDGSASATDTDATATATDSDTEGAGLWCEDKDMDGFGDPNACVPGTPGEEPPPGQVPNDGDCDDGDANTFPGAAPLDDPEACMTDVDGDDFGDDMPSGPGVEPGTDCDDESNSTFPGAAEDEAIDACMKDEDGDGWGDASVPPGVDGGADCYDTNAYLNPGARVLFTAIDASGDIASVDVANGQIDVFATVDIAPLQGNYQVISNAISPADGLVYGSQSAKQRLVRYDYCDGGTPTELAPHGKSICGLAFDAEGVLFGVDSTGDDLVIFDPATGMVTDMKPLTVDGEPLNLASCGMAFDCVSGRMLITDGQQSRILSVDPATGDAMVVADVPEGQWTAVGLEFDPVSK